MSAQKNKKESGNPHRGVARVLRLVLAGLIKDKVLFKTDVDQVTAFNYGFHDRKSKPVPVKETFLSGKTNLKGTASQRWCLFRLLPQLFADKIPEGNNHSKVYLSYRQVVDIILAERIPRDCAAYLEVKVAEFLELYRVQYPSAAVTPKFQYLVHCPKYLLQFGPPWRFWGMRFEAKHSYFKSIASKVNNFRNICLTLSTRHQLLQAYELSGRMFDGPLETTAAKPLQATSLTQEQQAAVPDIPSEAELSSVATACWNSCHYRVGDVFVHSIEHDVPQFLKIDKLLVYSSTLVLLCQKLTTQYCSEHRSSYVVKDGNGFVAVIPDHDFDYYPLDLYYYADLCEVVPHYAVLEWFLCVQIVFWTHYAVIG
ncbi:hypothetical protein HPB48_009842 [Haemaphysalis longicornis]|uniref:Uncharacterized protein n=1 Tax=Haemaphysalis longicornis TaxID=44386 RepID=A0A9J6GRI8_HAELO|nr:hypothetical protein HPB48_009842 [Haemaphysalis longicornis]